MHYVRAVRTTLALDDDVLLAAKSIAGRERRSVGKVISDLARQSLNSPTPLKYRNGVPLLQKTARGVPITLELVNRLRDETP